MLSWMVLVVFSNMSWCETGAKLRETGAKTRETGAKQNVYHFVLVVVMFLKAAVAQRNMSVDSLAVGVGLLKCKTTSTMADVDDEVQRQIEAQVLFAQLIWSATCQSVCCDFQLSGEVGKDQTS